jgi:hypothetical protein
VLKEAEIMDTPEPYSLFYPNNIMHYPSKEINPNACWIKRSNSGLTDAPPLQHVVVVLRLLRLGLDDCNQT